MTDKLLIYLGFTCILMSLTACSQPKIALTAEGKRPIDTSRVINTARQQLGTEYKNGGASPTGGFDCSGLVYYSFKQAGLSLARTAYGQFKQSQPISRQHLRQGDLIFFRIYRSRVSHVGIYLGNNRFIHAPSSGKSVSIANLDNPYWQKRYIRAGRILN